MAIKITSTDGTVVYTSDNGNRYPINEDITNPHQVIGFSQGGQESIRDNNPNPRRIIRVGLVGESETSKDNLISTFSDAKIDWMMNELRYYPDASSGTYYTGRKGEAGISPTKGRGDIYDIGFTILRTLT